MVPRSTILENRYYRPTNALRRDGLIETMKATLFNRSKFELAAAPQDYGQLAHVHNPEWVAIIRAGEKEFQSLYIYIPTAAT